MFRHTLKIRLLATFVVAFICLNAGGAACVAYCRTSDGPTEGEHCPLKRDAGHCDKDEKESFAHPLITSENADIDCCPMTVNFLAAPLEKHSFEIETAKITSVVTVNVPTARVAQNRRHSLTSDYRGPPPLDRRPDRIKHRLLLI